MAKRTVSFGDYQESTFEEYTGEAPPPNRWFTGEVVRGKYLEEDDQVRFIIELVDDPDYAGWGKGWYAPFEGAQKWKMQEIVRALQGGQQKDVTIDWESDAQLAAWLKKGKRIRFQTEMYNDDIKIRKVRPLIEAAGTKTATKATAPKAEAELPGDTDAGDEQLEDYTEEELGEMKVAELEEILKEEFEVDLPAKPRRDPKGEKYADALIDAILEAQSEDADNPDAEEGAADGAEGEEFSDGFEEDPEPEPEPEPEPAKPARRSRAATKAAAPAAEPAPAPRARRARR